MSRHAISDRQRPGADLMETSNQPGHWWVRAGLAYLTVSCLTIGLWATLGPKGFYAGFPGGGHHWVAGDGPYNAHFVTDAGVGFLAVGAALLLAAIWMERRATQVALVAVLVHDAPHLLFHLRHGGDVLGSVDRAVSQGGLALGVSLAAILLAGVTRGRAPRMTDENVERNTRS